MKINRNLAGALIIVVLGLLGIGAYKLIDGWLFQQKQVQSSDAKVSLTMRVGGDSYLGYFFVNSPEMKRQALRRGMAIDFTNDGGAYADRLEKFAKGQYDAIVLPVNSYITHGQKYNYPGVIVASIAESHGADAILCFENKLPTGKIADLNDASLKIVYTGESPSSFLLDLTIVDFDLFNLKRTDSWRKELTGSDKVYEAAKRREGDCFVMWEPDVSRALRDVPGLKKVWGSDGFSGYIVDVFVFRRDFVSRNHDQVISFLEAYFSTMRSYASDRQRAIEDMKQDTGLKASEIEPMIKTISWHNLQENAARQFGLNTGVGAASSDGILNTVLATTNVLVRTGKLNKDPLGDPYKIINSNVLQTVYAKLPAEIGKQGSAKRQFSMLSDPEWKALKEIGIMRVEPITFQASTNSLSSPGELQVDKIAELLVNNYPDTRIVVRGHTGAGQDESENLRLSQERAEAVVQRLIAVHGIPASRLKAEGMGSSQPPQKRSGESPRDYMYRIPRVEFSLFQDNSF